MAEAKRINRSVYGQYGLANIEGYEVPYLSAAKAEELTKPGQKWFDASFGRGNIISDLGWSGNSFSNSLTRGAAAFGINKEYVLPAGVESQEQAVAGYPASGYSGVPSESPFGYKITGDINAIAQRFGINTEGLKPYEKEVRGEIYEPDAEGYLRPTGRTDVITQPVGNEENIVVGYKPLTRTVSVEEQIYDKINEATKDYYAYTGDTLVPGQAGEGSPNSFQTVLYKKEGDVLKPITKPVEHGGMQNPDVYFGGGGFKLSELVRGVAPIAAFAIGAPFLDAALAGSAAAASGAGAAGGAQTGNAMLASLGLGAEAALPYTAAAGLPANLFTLAPSAVGSAGALSLGDDLAQLMQTYPNMSAQQLQSIAEINYGLNPTTAFDAANLAASGYNPATINQVLGYSYTPAELTGTGIESFAPSISQVPQYPGDSQYIEQDIMEQARATNVPSGSPTSWDTGVKPFITPGMALQGARLGMGLLSGGQQQQQQQQAQMPRQNIMPRGQGVDYSGIYNLLGLQRPTNPNSLLG
jgi:hypothetical protein